MVPWPKGVPRSEETKQKIREANKGKRFSPETEFKKGMHASPKTEFKKDHPSSEKAKQRLSEVMKGVPKSEVQKRKIAEARRGEPHPHKGVPRSEETKRKIREARLNRVFPTKDTSIEVKMQNELKRRGIAFQTHVPLCGICQPDIVIPEKRIVIHCDGDYWHSLPKTKIRDKNQDKTLRIYGWKVYRFWEHEINSNIENCVNQIIESLGLI